MPLDKLACARGAAGQPDKLASIAATGAKQQHLQHQTQQLQVCQNGTVKKPAGYGACERRSKTSLLSFKRLDSNRSSSDDGKAASPPGLGAGKSLAGNEEHRKRTALERLAKLVPGLGIILALCASLFLATAGLLVKLTTSVHGIQVAVFRAIIQLFIYSTILSLRRVGWMPTRGEFLPAMLRATLGGTSIIFSYHALKLIPLGDATAIRFSLPIWTMLLGYLFLGEPCGLSKLTAVLVAVAGVVLIAKPDDCVYMMHALLHAAGLESETDFQFQLQLYERERVEQLAHLEAAQADADFAARLNQSLAVLTSGPAPEALELAPPSQLEGCLMALGSSVCLSMSLVALRLCRQTPAEISIFWLSICSVLIGSITLLLLDEWRLPNNLPDLAYILLNGLCGAIGQWFITSALKVEQSSVVALARTFDIEIAFLYSALLLHEHIRATSILGAALISLGVIIVIVPKWLVARSNSAPANASEPANRGHEEEGETRNDSTRPDPAAAAAAWKNSETSLASSSTLVTRIAIDGSTCERDFRQPKCEI